MKIPIIIISVLAGLGLLVLFIRDRATPTYKASANEIPAVVERLRSGQGNPRFAVFIFFPPGSKDGEAVNLQYSFENGVVGFDWVLLGPRNVSDKNGIIEFAKERGQVLTEHNMNNVQYLRLEGAGAAELGIRIIRDFYKIDPNLKLEMIVEGFEWPSPAA